MYGCKEITTCHFDAILTASVVAGLSCSVVSGFVNYYFANCLFQIEWNFNIFIFAFNGEYMDLLTSSNYRPHSSYHFGQSGYDFFGFWNQQVV